MKIFSTIQTTLSVPSCGYWIIAAATLLAPNASADWLGFRGDSTGSSAPVTVPNSSADVSWQIKMPGRSVASPIVIGDTVVTTSSGGPDGEDLFITGLSVDDGQTQFELPIHATGRPFHYETSAGAAPTPISDGETIVAFFSSADLVAIDREGHFLWTRSLGLDFPAAGNDIGLAASPVIADDVVVVAVESAGESYAIGIDLKTSKTRWRIDRPKKSNWSSPVVIERPGDVTEIVLTSSQDVVAIDPQTGATQWQLPLQCPTITSAVAADGVLLIPADGVTAYRYDQAVGPPTWLWQNSQLSTANPSIVTDGRRLYITKDSILMAGSVETGELLWRQRLRDLGRTWATPLLAGDKLILSDQSGTIVVIQDVGGRGDEVARFSIDENIYASPAASDGRLILRSYRSLIRF